MLCQLEQRPFLQHRKTAKAKSTELFLTWEHPNIYELLAQFEAALQYFACKYWKITTVHLFELAQNLIAFKIWNLFFFVSNFFVTDGGWHFFRFWATMSLRFLWNIIVIKKKECDSSCVRDKIKSAAVLQSSPNLHQMQASKTTLVAVLG